MNFLWTVAQKALKITDKSVDVTFASCFQNDVFIIVVPVKKKQQKLGSKFLKMSFEFLKKHLTGSKKHFQGC